MGVDELIKSKRADILQIAAQHGARNVRIFGSVARGEATPDSDIDVLVEFEPGRTLLDRVSLYLPPERGMDVLEQIARKRVGEVWVNPGAGSPELMARGRELGLNMIAGCSIVDIGVDPHQLG